MMRRSGSVGGLGGQPPRSTRPRGFEDFPSQAGEQIDPRGCGPRAIGFSGMHRFQSQSLYPHLR